MWYNEGMKKKLLRVFEVVVAAVMAVTVLPLTTLTETLAASKLSEKEMYFYSQNGIYFYLPGGKTCFGTLSGSTIFEKTLSYLLSLGFTEAAAAGIYGNMVHEGLGGGILLNHENGMDARADIGTYYTASVIGNRPITENDVRGLDDASVMHGLGLIQWSYGRRVNFLKHLDEKGVGEYARAWDDAAGVYVYDSMTYDEMTTNEGQDVADTILAAELEYLSMEMAGRDGSSFKVYQNDVDAQGLSKYGITAGMSAYDALNLVETPAEAAELFFSTMEMPGWGSFQGRGEARVASAEEGYELISSAGITASGATSCSKGGSIAEVALELSWEGHDHAKDDPKPEYVEAMEVAGTNLTPCNSSGCAPMGASCDIFVATVMIYSEADPDFPKYGPNVQEEHMLSHPEMYEEIENVGDTSNMEPGDILVVSGAESGRHIYLYVGEIDGQPTQASASFNGRTGEHFAYMSFSDYGKPYRIFRRINL